MSRDRGLQLYALLLRLYPKASRHEYEAGMIEMFELRAAEAAQHKNAPGRVWFVIRELGGLTLGAVRQRFMLNRQASGPERFRNRRSQFVGPLVQDIRYAVRRLIKNPGFTTATVLTLALGIGANTAIFSLVKGVVLNPLPYPDADRLVRVQHSAPGVGYPELNISRPTYRHYRDRNHTLENIGVYRRRVYNLTGEGAPERVVLAQTTSSFFRIFQVAPSVGRVFVREDELPDAARVAVLSYGLWSNRFGADPSAVGRSIQLDGVTYDIVGVMPRSFAYPATETQLWVAVEIDPNDTGARLSGFPAIARLAPGVSPAEAARDLNTAVSQLPETIPGFTPSRLANLQLSVLVTPLKEDIVGDIRQTLWILFGTVGFVLLIACANVASLFLVRAEGRQREVAVRTALGAGPGQLTRFFLSESTLLGALGGALGLVLATIGMRTVVTFGSVNIPRIHEVGMDVSVLAFTAAISLLAGVAFGAMPLVRPQLDVTASLKDSGRGSTRGRHRTRAQNALVVAQIALALVLLVGSGLMVRSFWHLRNVDPGFDPYDVLTLRVHLPDARYPTAMDAAATQQTLVDRINALPGVVAAAAIDCLPLLGCTDANMMEAEDYPLEPNELPPGMPFSTASPGYFRTLRIPIVSGREFERRDHEERMGAILISQAVAERFWPGQDPVGKRIYPGLRGSAPWYTIAGVVSSIRQDALTDSPAEMMYLPMVEPDLRGYTEQHTMALVIRVDGSPLALLDQVRRVIREVDANLPIANVQTMEEVVSNSTILVEFTMLLLGIAAVVALCLGAVGIYGVVSYVVGRRAGEIGLRMALGANATDVRWMVLRQGGRVAVAGLLLGLVGAFGLTRLMTALLFEVSPTDPLTYAGVSIVLLAVTLMATDLPARRAARGDPAAALKTE